MEAVNLGTVTDDIAAPGQREQRVHGTLHYGRQPPGNLYSGTSYKASHFKPTEQFHVYALEWEEGEIRWYIDACALCHSNSTRLVQSVPYLRTESGNNHQGAAPFDQSFHLLLNLAVGGNWPENVNEKGVDI